MGIGKGLQFEAPFLGILVRVQQRLSLTMASVYHLLPLQGDEGPGVGVHNTHLDLVAEKTDRETCLARMYTLYLRAMFNKGEWRGRRCPWPGPRPGRPIAAGQVLGAQGNGRRGGRRQAWIGQKVGAGGRSDSQNLPLSQHSNGQTQAGGA